MAMSPKKDLPGVTVEDGDIEQAARRFHYLFKNSGIVTKLRFRADNPSRFGRKREKRRKAMRRLKRQQNRATTR